MFGLKEFGSYKRMGILLADILLVHLAYLFAFLLRYGYPFPEYNFSSYRAMVPYITAGAVILFSIYGLLNVTRKTRIEMMQSVLVAVVLLNVVTMATTFFMRTFSFPRSIFAIALTLQLIIIAGFYLILLKIQRIRHQDQCITIIGHRDEAEAVAEKIMAKYNGWFANMVICLNEKMESCDDLIRQTDWVFLCPGVSVDSKRHIMQLCIKHRKELQLAPDFYEIMNVGSIVGQLDDLPVLRIEAMHLSVEQRMIKRFVDVVVSVIALIILAPLIVVIAVSIKTSSPGPVFYTQKRVTRDGREFDLYKFRSMVKNAEKTTGPVLARENDQRITRVGRWLRSGRLDEVPQLINVVKGDMSLVGPRPERRVFVEAYELEMPHYQYRKTVKAGITGLSQVRGKYSTSVEDKLRMDLLYIRNHSFWLDLMLILQTLQVLMNREKAKGMAMPNNLQETANHFGFQVKNSLNQITIEKTAKSAVD